MIDVLAEEQLDRATWVSSEGDASGSPDPHKFAAFICESYTCSKNAVSEPRMRWSVHSDGVLRAWLQDDATESVEKGGFRMILCDRTDFRGFSISKANFNTIKASFKLCASTLAGIGSAMGHCSRSVKIHKEASGKTSTTASMVLKNSRKFQLGDWLLSLTYDATTRRTFAFIHGKVGSGPTLDPMKRWRSNTVYGSTAEEPGKNVGLFVGIFKYLYDCSSHWNHPLLVPVALFTFYMDTTREHCERRVDSQVLLIEEALGVSRNQAYANVKQEDVFGNADIEKVKTGVKALTVRLNVVLTEVIILETNSEWLLDASKFLIETLDEWETSKIIDSDLDVDGKIRETLAFHAASAKAIQARTRQAKARLDSQMNVLYNLIAQTDNRLSAQMAASTGRDSAAMKALAFIAALFLPATFIATLFSMSVFDWQAGLDSGSDGDSDDESSKARVVSPLFWLYWAIAVPLTAVVIGGWRLWWTFERKAYDSEMRRAIHGSEGHSITEHDKTVDEKEAGIKPILLNHTILPMSDRWTNTLFGRKKKVGEEDIELSIPDKANTGDGSRLD